MSFQRHHRPSPEYVRLWGTHATSRSQLHQGERNDNRGSNNDTNKRYQSNQHYSESISKQPRISADRSSSMFDDLLANYFSENRLTDSTLSTLRKSKYNFDSLFDGILSTYQPETKSTSSVPPNTESLHQKQQEEEEDSDESIESFLKRTGNSIRGSPRRTKHKGDSQNTTLSLYRQEKQQKDKDKDKSIDTSFRRTKQKTPSDYTSSTSSRQSNVDSVESIDTNTTIDDTTYYALFGTKRHSSKRMMYKKRPKTKESTQTPNAIKKLLEDMTTEPLPVPDPKSEQEEIEFFIGEKETPKNNEQRALANGFTGFSDEGEDDDSDEDENGDSDELD